MGLSKVGKVFVVSKNLYRKRGAMEVVSPGIQGANDGKEFMVINIVISFCRGGRLREVGARVPFSIGISLEEGGARGIL